MEILMKSPSPPTCHGSRFCINVLLIIFFHHCLQPSLKETKRFNIFSWCTSCSSTHPQILFLLKHFLFIYLPFSFYFPCTFLHLISLQFYFFWYSSCSAFLPPALHWIKYINYSTYLPWASVFHYQYLWIYLFVFQVVVQISALYNMTCTHQNFCHPHCYKRNMRACRRLMHAVRKVILLVVNGISRFYYSRK